MDDGPRARRFLAASLAGLLVLAGAGCQKTGQAAAPVVTPPTSVTSADNGSVTFICVDDQDVATALAHVKWPNESRNQFITEQLKAFEQKGWQLRGLCSSGYPGDKSLAFSFNKTGELTQADLQQVKHIYPISKDKVLPGIKLQEGTGYGLFVLGYASTWGQGGPDVEFSEPILANGGPNQDGYVQRLSLGGDGRTNHEVVLAQTSGGDYGIWQATLMFDPQAGKLSQLQYCNDVINPNTKTPGDLGADSFITKCQ